MEGSIIQNILKGQRVKVRNPYYHYEKQEGTIIGYAPRAALAKVEIKGIMGYYPLSKLRRIR